LLLALASGCARPICEPADRRCRDLERLLEIQALLQIDPGLRWRQRANLDVLFEGTRVVTDEHGFRVDPTEPVPKPAPEAPIIAAFGASPDFGYGVEASEAWPARLARGLAEQGLGARVVNAGQIGYSSWQGLRLYDLTKRWLPFRVAIVSFVVNDVEQLRFFFPDGHDDRSSVAPSGASATLRNALSAWAPFEALRRAVFRSVARRIDPDRPRELLTHAFVRVLPADYEENLRGFVNRGRRLGVATVFLQMPFRLPEPVPDAPPGIEERLDEIEKLLVLGDAAGARSLADQAVAQDPFHRRAWRLRAQARDALGDTEGARADYAEAVRHMIHGCARDARTYNAIMKRVADETGTPVVDAASLLGGDRADMELFVPGDYIHPNAEGHRRIALKVLEILPGLLSRVR
jgi:lysophospholipase L1-like esterase